jgi:transposase-like protein
LEVRPQLSVYGRWLLVQRVMSGRPVAHVAAELGISRATGYKWWRRWQQEGMAGLHRACQIFCVGVVVRA